MIDCLETTLPLAARRHAAGELGLRERGFALATLHRPSNVDDSSQLLNLTRALVAIAAHLPVVFPVHARTAASLEAAGCAEALRGAERVHILPPLGYIDFLSLMNDARVVLTDSGGVQAEACVVGTPCVTARTSTEWTETVEAGLNTLADPYDVGSLVAAVEDVLERPLPIEGVRPPLWDGRASERTVAVIAEWARQKGRHS
jgi:UDP-N-acetylglucosamine 2-epimerase (non-hydrolysing)